ncbi:MAG: thioesterase II family protein [Ignavibacteriales bacterium]
MYKGIKDQSLVIYLKPRPSAPIRLFCLPYAGGGAHIFRKWSDAFPGNIEVCPLELPGRGRRIAEPLINNMELLVEEIAGHLVSHLDKPFCFFGHSMGALISYELTRYLKKIHKVSPVHLFASAHPAPGVLKKEPVMHTLPDKEFIVKLEKMNGMPGEVLNNRELMEIMLPILRSDFRVCETYSPKENFLTDCPITVFGGLNDSSINQKDLIAWKNYTSSTNKLHMLPGDHFFLYQQEKYIISTICNDIMSHAFVRYK